MNKIEYRTALLNVTDEEGLPVTISISVDKEYQSQFEEWLLNEQDNSIAHAVGGSIEY